MRCRKISLEYKKQEDNLFPETLIQVEKVPPSVLQQIAKQYGKKIDEEGVARFIVFDFGDVTLKFRFEGKE